MNWPVLLSAFGLVFLAELGDKTQLAAFTLAAKTRRPWEVFAGASLALVVVTGLGVVLGDLIRRAVPAKALAIGAAVMFIAVGVVLLVKAMRGGE